MNLKNGAGVFVTHQGGGFKIMVRHVEFGVANMDSGALAEGVWEYVSDLVKSYRSQDVVFDMEPYRVGTL